MRSHTAHTTNTQVALLPVEVIQRAVVARDVVTLWLARPGERRAPAPYQPGQFITLALPASNGAPIYRSYSLCGDGRDDQPWEIAVKRQRGGAVSNFLYDRAAPGMRLASAPPRGSFTLPRAISPATPLIFVAAGSGVTPIYGMLRFLARLPQHQRPQAQLHYGAGASDELIYSRELVALDPNKTWLRLTRYLSAEGVRLTPELVLRSAELLGPTAHWYICGPDALQRSFVAALHQHGAADAQIHVEVFGDGAPPTPARPTAAARASSAAPVARLRLADTGATLDVRADETLLETLERSGYRPAFSCRAGSCGVCRVQLLTGSIRDDVSARAGGLTQDERAAGWALTCVSRPIGDVTLATGGAAPGSGRAPAAHQLSKAALRIGTTAAAAALFAGAWNLTNVNPFASANGDQGQSAQPTPTIATPITIGGPKQRPTTGPSGITTNPSNTVPGTTSGAS